MSKVGRNDPCPCGSGKKHKLCCLNKNILPFSSTGDNYDSSTGNYENDFERYKNFVENWDSDNPPPSLMEFLGKPNPASAVLNELHKGIAGKSFASKEELEAFTIAFNQREAQKGIDDFLGLSSAQVHRILHSPLFVGRN